MVAASRFGRKLRRLVELKCAGTAPVSWEGGRTDGSASQQQWRLAQATGIEDEQLLSRLIGAGLTAETVAALAWLPIAKAAWASGTVTRDERRAALDLRRLGAAPLTPEALDQFRAWLDEEPSDELWTLWEDFTRAERRFSQTHADVTAGQRLWRHAWRVANASGGWCGWGAVCWPEEAVLLRIARTHGLDQRQLCA